MAQLAIRGHNTRGKEVIEIFEMLGGKNLYAISADTEDLPFTIRDYDNYIVACYPTDKYVYFTFEEFLEKYPYKVGDKVQHKGATSCGSVYEVEKMRWVDNKIEYTIKRLWYQNDHHTTTAEDLQPYKETMEERKYADLRLDADQDDKLATEATIDGDKITSPKNYLIGKITKVDNGLLVEFVKKQSQYPKTYKECCDVFSISPYYNLKYHTNEYGYHDYTKINKLCSLRDKLNILGKLLICRDAYWKIAGEQMGLGKPWKPNYTDNNIKYSITTHKNRIDFNATIERNYVLIFPTEEMRTAFYENFKDLIGACKELL